MQTPSDFPRATQKPAQGNNAAPQTFLTGPQVQFRYQKSHVTIWRWMNDPALGFPSPIQINRLNYWRLADLEAWENVQAAGHGVAAPIVLKK